MSVEHPAPDPAELRKCLHDLNNRLGALLATTELLKLEQLSSRAAQRRQTIEDVALEIRDIVRSLTDRYL